MGNICGVHDFERDSKNGHLHLIRTGPVAIVDSSKKSIEITEPTIIFMPRPDRHRLIADETSGADVVCATIQFGGSAKNPICDSLPDLVMVKLIDLPNIEPLLALMFAESLNQLSGKQWVLDRLCEVLIIQLLRYCMEVGLTKGGTLAAFADKKISLIMNALYTDPSRAWDLPEMAKVANMSRARFAIRFREVTGHTPADYVTDWKINVTQKLLMEGKSLKVIANKVGYGSSSALIRAFERKTGQSPRHWLESLKVSE